MGDPGTPLWSVGSDYSPTGELISSVDSACGRTVFTLDQVGRVTSATGQGRSETYGYDAAGNLTAAARTSAPAADETARSYSGTLLIRAGRDRFRYDDAGRLVERRRALLSGGSRVWTSEWDALDRLRTATTPGGAVWTYEYDPWGRRIAKASSDGDVTRFSWDGPVMVEQAVSADTADGSTHAVTTWKYDGWSSIACLTATGNVSDPLVDAQFRAIVTDLVGTPVRVVTELGDTAWEANTSLWGYHHSNTMGGEAPPLRFPGHYEDTETGLHYNLYRYYDPPTPGTSHQTR